MKYLFIYIIFINIVTFIVYAIDKRKARKNTWRISERTLIFLCIIGGSFGGILAVNTLRHKTKHKKFTIGIPIILAVQFILFFYIHTSLK